MTETAAEKPADAPVETPVKTVEEEAPASPKVGQKRKAEESPERLTKPLPPGKALRFTVNGRWNRCRTALLELPHGPVSTPVFMPVGTQGTIKGLMAEQVADLGCEIILGNTYHLANRPGCALLDKFEGLHKFMKWPRNLLTDSGGFQMVSLLKLAVITEEGVEFENPHDGSRMLLTPEKSMECQNSIGADIMMALDDVVSSTCEDKARVEEATHRTSRWIDRCIKAHKRPHEQNLFGIVQGGLHEDLRTISLAAMIERDLPGYAIGGLSGGEEKAQFWKVVEQCTRPGSGLPDDKPRYLMGVGYSLDLVVCVALGVDMFDCVYPCRTARFGTALVPSGQIRLTRKEFENDQRLIDDECDCTTCKAGYTRASLHMLATKQPTASTLLTVHNISYMMRLMRQMREAINDGSFPQFVRNFMSRFFPKETCRPPDWVRDALKAADIDIEDLFDWSKEAAPDMPHEK